MTALLAALLKGLADFFARLVADWRRDGALQGKGRAEGSADLNKGISEIADAQAQNNAVDRGGARGVLDRLRNPAGRERPGGE
ncbi:MAG: hypothetical protein IOC64_06650 [Methylobacterium sp.]|nr:hypothetical protein [Methylobacterium sp.]